jgi:hypothetical protein
MTVAVASGLADAAARYAACGMEVFPLRPRGKAPLTAHGLKDASADAATVAQWWRRWPTANIGLALPPGLMVLDVDGEAGRASLAELEHQHGPLPATRTVRTGGGGEHRYFRVPAGAAVKNDSKGKLGTALHIRAGGGYTVLPPSEHASGRRYEWADRRELADCPAGLLTLLTAPVPNAAPSPASAGDGIPEGQRHAHLLSLAGSLQRKGAAPAAIEAALLAENAARCRPPKSEPEVRALAADVCARYQPDAPPRAAPTAGAPGVRMSTVLPHRVHWLWPGRIPSGKITVLDGDPGLGKSTITLDIAARVSAGRPMPDGEPGVSGGVVLASAEDDLADTVRPRLNAAGADCDRVLALRACDWGTVAEIETLRGAIRGVEAVLVIIDPLMAYLGPGAEVNSYRDQDVRAALAPLAALASETGAAIVLVRHLRKSADGNPIYRGGGSIGIIGAARAGLLVAKDPDDPERRVLAVTKANLAREAPSLAYRSIERDGAVAIEWLGASAHQAAALLAQPASAQERGELAEAVDWLRERLGAGDVPTREVLRDARDAGISPRTLDRARAQLCVRAGNSGRGTPWVLSLPDSAKAPESANTSPIGGLKESSINTRAPLESANTSPIGGLKESSIKIPEREPGATRARPPDGAETLGAAYARARREGRVPEAGPSPDEGHYDL